MQDGLRIGELARACDVSRDTLRFYEREKLLPAPRRSASGYRLYREEDAARVRFVRRAQAIGLTLDDVRELLRIRHARTPEECRRVAARLRARIGVIDQKISQLRDFREELASNLARCESAHNRGCPVVLDLAGNGGVSPRRTR